MVIYHEFYKKFKVDHLGVVVCQSEQIDEKQTLRSHPGVWDSYYASIHLPTLSSS